MCATHRRVLVSLWSIRTQEMNDKPNGKIYATVNIFIEWLVFVQTYNHRADTHTHKQAEALVVFWVAKRHIAGIFMIAK